MSYRFGDLIRSFGQPPSMPTPSLGPAGEPPPSARASMDDRGVGGDGGIDGDQHRDHDKESAGENRDRQHSELGVTEEGDLARLLRQCTAALLEQCQQRLRVAAPAEGQAAGLPDQPSA
jgi:hypothetical protein